MLYVDGHDLADDPLTRDAIAVPGRRRWCAAWSPGYVPLTTPEVVHRDLKPANIIIHAHDEARIMDFGIARSTSQTTTVYGTRRAGPDGQTRRGPPTPGRRTCPARRWKAPSSEHWRTWRRSRRRGQMVDQRADIYSLGRDPYQRHARWTRPRLTHRERDPRIDRADAGAASIDPGRSTRRSPSCSKKVIARCPAPRCGTRVTQTTKGSGG